MLLILKWFFTGNYILNYVASQPKLAPFVIQALVQVIAKITKLGWFEVLKDQLIFRNIITDVKKFLQVGNNNSLLPLFLFGPLHFSWLACYVTYLLYTWVGKVWRALLKTEDCPTVKNQGGFGTCGSLWVLMSHSIHSAVLVYLLVFFFQSTLW